MAFNTPNMVQRIGTFSDAARMTASLAQSARWERATKRRQVAKFAARLHGEKHYSFREIARLIGDAVESGLLPAHRALSYESIRGLIAAWNDGKRDIGDYMEQLRCGRPATVDTFVTEMVTEAVRCSNVGSIRQLHLRVAREAARLGTEAPSYDTIKRLVATHGRLPRAAARHGARIAQMDAMAHSTVPAQWAHDTWVLDEFDAPAYCRVFDPDILQWVSVRPVIILVVDHRSGVCVSHWIADPSRRRNEKTDRIMRAGFDADDVLAALFNASCRDLASPACAQFAGFLPERLRWDNHATHRSLRPILQTLGERAALDVHSFFAPSEDTPDSDFNDWHETAVLNGDGTPAVLSGKSGVIIKKLPFHRPINRAKIERNGGTAKRLCADLESHVDQVIPMDRLLVDPKEERDLLAGSGLRVMRRDPIAVEHLPTIEEFRALFDARIRYFNYEHVSKRVGVPRVALYMQHFSRRRARAGSDLLAAVSSHTAFVTRDGIEHHHDSRSTLFAYAVTDKFYLALDRPVTYKPDPLQRMIFAELDGRIYPLPPKLVYASAPDRDRETARAQSAMAGYYAGQAIMTRARAYDVNYGLGAYDKAEGDARTTLTELRANKRQADARAAELAQREADERRAHDETRAPRSPNSGADGLMTPDAAVEDAESYRLPGEAVQPKAAKPPKPSTSSETP